MMHGRTRIEKRLPQEERKKLDEMLLRAPSVSGPVSDIHQRLELHQRYGISLSSLYGYALRLREQVQLEVSGDHLADFNGRLNRLDLPDDLRTQVEHAVIAPSPELVNIRRIYDHFELRDHRVSFQRFRSYVRLLRWRMRLDAAGHIIGALFPQQPLSRLGHKVNSAQLQLIAVVLKALQDENEIKTEELLKLSKILAEQQTAIVKAGDLQLKERKLDAELLPPPPAPPPTTGLPPNFDEVVRQIYGVDVSGVGPAMERLEVKG